MQTHVSQGCNKVWEEKEVRLCERVIKKEKRKEGRKRERRERERERERERVTEGKGDGIRDA